MAIHDPYGLLLDLASRVPLDFSAEEYTYLLGAVNGKFLDGLALQLLPEELEYFIALEAGGEGPPELVAKLRALSPFERLVALLRAFFYALLLEEFLPEEAAQRASREPLDPRVRREIDPRARVAWP